MNTETLKFRRDDTKYHPQTSKLNIRRRGSNARQGQRQDTIINVNEKNGGMNGYNDKMNGEMCEYNGKMNMDEYNNHGSGYKNNNVGRGFGAFVGFIILVFIIALFLCFCDIDSFKKRVGKCDGRDWCKIGAFAIASAVLIIILIFIIFIIIRSLQC